MSVCAPTTLDEAIAGAVEDALPDVLAVHRVTRTPDSSGGHTESYAPDAALAAVPCRIMPPNSTAMSLGEQILADRLALVDPYVISVPKGTDIRVTDRLVALGDTFHVQSSPDHRSTGLHGRVLATVVG